MPLADIPLGDPGRFTSEMKDGILPSDAGLSGARLQGRPVLGAGGKTTVLHVSLRP